MPTSRIVLEGAVESTWPAPASPAAFSGLLGKFVKELQPHTEADPHAVLAQSLVMFGNIVGRSPHFMVGATRHGLNMFANIVGPTGTGRKGMGRDAAVSLVRLADLTWPRYITGLSSGEGLIHQVRDPVQSHADTKKGKKPRHPQSKSKGDPGVRDKRLLVIESEFASVLQILKRAGSTLSPVMRQAWDGDVLQVASRQTAAMATDPHISIIGQITNEELLNSMGTDDTLVFNGFANRFLWVMTRRANRLPEGGGMPLAHLQVYQNKLKAAVRFAQGVQEMKRTQQAKLIWDKHYDRLTDGLPGLVGGVISRAAPYVMRLACCYALLDRERVVREEHVKAGLAFWDYCEASAKHIFGRRTGQTHADRVLSALRERRNEGLSRKQIYRDVFHKHLEREQIRQALQVLLNSGFAKQETRRTAGRPEERWFAC